jgi:hypothetical protein
MQIFRVHYLESERGFNQDRWYTDYATLDEAQRAYRDTNAKNISKTTPDWYLVAERIETINIDTDIAQRAFLTEG